MENDNDVNETIDNMADRQPAERAGRAGEAHAPDRGTTTDAPVVPSADNPNIPAGAVPPGGPAPSPQDIIREEADAAAKRDDEDADRS